MSQFNPGDRVRFVQKGMKWEGRIGTVIEPQATHLMEETICVLLDNYPSKSSDRPLGHWQFSASALELIHSSLDEQLTAALAPLFAQLKTAASEKSS